MKYCFFVLVVILLACQAEEKKPVVYQVRDYRQVKLYLDTLNAAMQEQLDSSGTYTIPYTYIQKGKKELIFFGASHVRDINHPQFTQLIKAFDKLKPQIAFNEGGQIRENVHYPSLDSAVLKNGETGVLKFLCDRQGIKMLDGDMDTKSEFAALLNAIPKEQLYLYLAIERFLDGYRKGYFGDAVLEDVWKTKFIDYLTANGFPLTSEEQSLGYFKKVYKKYLHKEFDINQLEEVYEYYLVNDGVLGDVSRATKMVRDQALLSKIDDALTTYDRVFIVFGGSHRIAVEPALHQIMDSKVE